MIAFAILLLIVILILVLITKSNTSAKLAQLQRDMTLIKKHLAEQAAKGVPTAVAEEAKPIVKPDLPPVMHTEKEWTSGFKEMTEPAATFKKEDWLPKEEPAQQQPVAFAQPETTVPEPPFIATPTQTISSKPKKPTFFERNPDLEKFIGENLVSKIGIAILVLAIGYFVKYAIDNDWIGAVGRVAVGIVCGAILIGVAHRLRTNYKAFSSVLVGGGLAIFYFTITLAYQQFHIFSQTVAFVILLVITLFAVLLSLLYNRQELAVIALVGGFASPFLVSNGSGNYITLFIYLIILNTGLLLIAYNKVWRILNITAFVFTAILFASWLYALPDNTGSAIYTNGFVFATVFYILFFLINVLNNIKEQRQFLPLDFSILLVNTGLFFSVGLYCLNKMNATAYNGLFSAAMGVFNLGVSYFLLRKNKVDKNILYLLIGITLTFISLTAPLQLHGHFITLFWASEAVLLCWLFLKSKLGIIQYTSLLVFIAMLFSLMIDWQNVYDAYVSSDVSARPAALPVIFNRGFITSVYAAAASYLLFYLLHKNKDVKKLAFINAAVFQAAGIVLLFIGGAIEINYQFSYHYPFTNISLLYEQLYIFLFVLVLSYVGRRARQLVVSTNLQLVLFAGCLLLYFTTLSPVSYVQNTLLSKEYHQYSYLFAAHWAAALLIAVIIYRLVAILRARNSVQPIVTWLVCCAVVLYLSTEVYLIINSLFYATTSYADLDRIFIKVILPVLWGLCSFGCMWLGMQYKYKTLRIVSLTLFSVTLLKLFLYDISNIPVAGKIAAFFCLGVLLLIISFMYQRLKKIIIEDEAKPHV